MKKEKAVNLEKSLSTETSEAKTSGPSHKDDFFNLETLRLTQDFAGNVGVKKKIITVPVRKPHRQLFVRVHPNESWRLETAVLQDKEDRETYLVGPEMWPELPGEIVPTVLFTTLSRQGVVSLRHHVFNGLGPFLKASHLSLI